MPFEIRAPRPDEVRRAADVAAGALLHGPGTDEQWEESIPSRDASDMLIALDGERIVAHIAGFRFATHVPGGAALDTSGLTRVGVASGATRQGLLRTMLRQLNTEARDRGQVLSSLRASEAAIYPRFGYGLAGHAVEVAIDPRRARPVGGPTGNGSVRVLERSEVLDVVPGAYLRAAPSRPGSLVRPEWMWRRYLKSALPDEHDAGHVAVHRNEDGVDDGFCHYELSWEMGFGQEPQGKAELLDLWGATPQAEAALWRHVLSLDLITRIEAEERPVDDIGRWLLHDPRAYRVHNVYDEQWLRLLDVGAGLAARTYGDGRAVTIRVIDPWFDDNEATWSVGPEATGRSGQSPDLEVPVDVLSAAYLGGTSWGDLWRSGRVVEQRAGAVDDADRLFGYGRSPFCGSFF